MHKSKAMGLGAMMLFLVVAVVILPIVVRFIDKMEPHYVAGFQNMMDGVQNVPSMPAEKTYHPDANMDFLCRSPNGSGEPCEEGTFCDGPTQSCVKKYVGGEVPEVGYYA